jgi:hypothetical protein
MVPMEIGTVRPNPMTIRQKISMFVIEASGMKSKWVMDTPGMTKRVINDQEVVGQGDCLELNLYLHMKLKKMLPDSQRNNWAFYQKMSQDNNQAL